jgi:diguanylate cyclase (GGDEF)-like protein
MLHAMAITDQLTGLYNRSGFITLAEQQLKYADRTKRKVLLSFIDLDDMKNINDIWGHEEGDRALVNTAKILKQAFRESDIIARIGGDEFAVLASDAIDAMQDVLINRLHQQIDIHNTQKDLIYMLALSIGSTFYEPDNPRSLDELMSKADKLMYEDKRRKGV